jgi:glucokinase
MTHASKKFTVGIDVGGTKILTTLWDAQFRLQAEVKNKTKTEAGQEYFVKTIIDSVRTVMDEADVLRSQVAGVGIGCPGVIDARRGVVVDSPNISFLKNLPLAKILSRKLKLPVVLGNDVQTGLYGEYQFGAAKGYSNVIGIFLGTGIGGALIIDGRPYAGTSGSAGEIGHLQVDPQGPLCGCGQRGCFEALAGRLAIAAEAAVAVARHQAPHLDDKTGADIRAIKSGTLAKAIEAGDRPLAQLIRRKAELLGRVMASLANVINPELFVLGGGLVQAMPALISKEAERSLRAHALRSVAQHAKVAVAKLGDYSTAMGAAQKAADQFGPSRG